MYSSDLNDFVSKYLGYVGVFVVYNNCGRIESRVPYSQRYLVLGLVGLGLPLLLWLGLVGLALWLSGIVLSKYRCEYGTLNSMFAIITAF